MEIPLPPFQTKNAMAFYRLFVDIELAARLKSSGINIRIENPMASSFVYNNKIVGLSADEVQYALDQLLTLSPHIALSDLKFAVLHEKDSSLRKQRWADSLMIGMARQLVKSYHQRTTAPILSKHPHHPSVQDLIVATLASTPSTRRLPEYPMTLLLRLTPMWMALHLGKDFSHYHLAVEGWPEAERFLSPELVKNILDCMTQNTIPHMLDMADWYDLFKDWMANGLPLSDPLSICLSMTENEDDFRETYRAWWFQHHQHARLMHDFSFEAYDTG